MSVCPLCVASPCADFCVFACGHRDYCAACEPLLPTCPTCRTERIAGSVAVVESSSSSSSSSEEEEEEEEDSDAMEDACVTA